MTAHRRKQAFFRFYGELNDFLPVAQRCLPIRHDFDLPASVKDMFEALGVPHPEVELILVNGTPVEFGHLVHDGERVSVYPEFRELELGPLSQLRPRLQDHRFVLDSHLGRLARYLRLLGFDALYEPESEDKDLARISNKQGRVLLTRDRGLLKRNEVIYGYFVRETEAGRQVMEVLRRFRLFAVAAPLRRCLRCNQLLKPASRESIRERLQPRTLKHYHEFQICPSCDRVYWAGSHYRHMIRFAEAILAQREDSY